MSEAEQSVEASSLTFSERARRLWSGAPGLWCLAAAELPIVLFYYRGLWVQQSHYQFFPFAVLAFGLLLAGRAGSAPFRSGRLTKALVAGNLLLVALGIASTSPWVGMTGWLMLMTALTMGYRDQIYGTGLVNLSLLLWITLRLPANLDQRVILWLQEVTTKVAGRLMQHAGYLHVQRGIVLEFPGREFLVEEACSGVQSLFTLLFLASLIVCVRRRRLLPAVPVLGSALVFAGIMNVMRVITIVVAWEDYQLDLVSGWKHDLVGYLALGIAGLFLLSGDALMVFLTQRVPDPPQPGVVSVFRNPLTRLWNRIFSLRTVTSEESVSSVGRGGFRRVVLAGCGVLFLVQLVALRAELRPAIMVEASSADLFPEVALPPDIDEFRLATYGVEERDTGNNLGQFSNVWEYRGGRLQARVACDHKFCGWHGLYECYSNTGWEITGQKVLADGEWKYMRVDLYDPVNGQDGLLYFSLFSETGDPVTPKETSVGGRLGETLGGVVRMELLEGKEEQPVTFQAQVFSVSAAADPDATEKLTALHLQTRELLKQHYLKSK